MKEPPSTRRVRTTPRVLFDVVAWNLVMLSFHRALCAVPAPAMALDRRLPTALALIPAVVCHAEPAKKILAYNAPVGGQRRGHAGDEGDLFCVVEAEALDVLAAAVA